MTDPYSHQDWTTVTFKKQKPVSSSELKEKEQKKAAYNRALKYEADEISTPKVTKLETRNFIKKARCERKLSQVEVANKINVQQRIYSSWESGKEPIPGNIISKLNRVLNINIKKGIIN